MQPALASDLTAPLPAKLDFNFHITTPRLYLSHVNPSSDQHVSFILALRHDKSYNKHRPNAASRVPDMEAARDLLVAGSERMARTGWGRYLVSLRPESDDEDSATPFSQKNLVPIGVVSMQRDRIASIEGPKIPDLGFGFLGQFQGKGYATEASLALMQWFREERGFDKFAAMTDPDNHEAKRMLTRLQFQCRGDRSVSGVVDVGKATLLSVWTIGVGDGEDALKELGL